jgi:hypothetical protein
MKTKMVAFIALAMLLALVVTPVYASDAPALPHAFYGTVDINGSAAPVGTEVAVMGEGVETGIGNNPIVTTVEGEYGGGADPLAPKLIVQGSVAEGSTVTFYVNGVSTGQTAQWHSGEVTEIDLAATIDESSTTTAITSSSSDTSDSTSSGTADSSAATTDDSTVGTADATSPESTGPESEAATGNAQPAPLVPPPPPSAGVGGVPVLWLVIGGVVLIGLIIAFWVARSRAY